MSGIVYERPVSAWLTLFVCPGDGLGRPYCLVEGAHEIFNFPFLKNKILLKIHQIVGHQILLHSSERSLRNQDEKTTELAKYKRGELTGMISEWSLHV